MDCPACQHQNRADLNFCVRCGTQLGLVCLRCSVAACDGDLYCGSCGTRLPAPVLAIGRSAAAPVVEWEAERKNVTILFADIAGFTAMSERLDPEDVTTIVNSCLSRMADVVLRFEGHIDKFIGDCIMAIFGAPIAHENHAELACRAALAMKREVDELNGSLPIRIGRRLALHIGINSGMVIAGGIGSETKRDYTVMGDPVNLAARLESLAKDDQIYVSAYTYNLARSLFEFTAQDQMPVKGKRDPVAVFELVRAKTEPGEARRASGGTIPLVGRRREIETLERCADQLTQGGGAQAVFLTAEPGVGKSRVQLELKNRFKQGEVRIVEGACRSFSRQTSYYLFGELFRSLFGIDADDTREAVGVKVAAGVPQALGLKPDQLDTEGREALPLIARLLGAPVEDPNIERMDGQELKMATFRAIGWFYASLAERRPLMLVLENLHHADATSVEVTAYLFQALKDRPCLLLLLMRPVKDHPSARLTLIARKALESRVTELAIERLTDRECDEFMRQLLRADTVPEPVLQLVRARGDGNPLYIEEIARGLLDDGIVVRDDAGKLTVVKDLSQVTIPTSIQGIIMARIDKLQGTLKELLNMAAVIGPVFGLDLIAKVAGQNDLDARLNQLVDLEIIFESRTFPDVEYSFRNVLIQEAIYSTLLHKRQKELHAATARALEELGQDSVEVLAQHWLGAGQPAKAFPYLVKSGLKAKAAYANADAAHYLRTALQHGGKKADRAEALLALADVLDLVGDLEAAIEALTQAGELLEEEVRRADALRNIGRIQEKRGDKAAAAADYDAAYAILERYPEAVETGMLLLNQSWLSNRARDYARASDQAQRALTIFSAKGDQERMAQAFNNLAVIHEGMGDLDRAHSFNLESLRLFTQLGNKRQIGNLHLSQGFLAMKRKDAESALDCFSQAYETMNRIGNRFGAGTACAARGSCLLELGRLDEAVAALEQALAIHVDLDLRRKVVANRIGLAEAEQRRGNAAAARRQLELARELAVAENLKADLDKIASLAA